jgi:hypothetical protein|tara:strand:- start:3083 stop:3253 length:171 start_codon:yes stop_codon:yes gene_type:complete
MKTKQQQRNSDAIDKWFSDAHRDINRWMGRHEFLTLFLTMVVGAALSFFLLWAFVY